MSLYTKICVALFGICGGIIVMFAVDMLFNSGRFAAHAVHAKTPKCSESCHGSTTRQNAAAAATVMVLPYLQATYRLGATQDRAGSDSLLGVQVEDRGRD